MKTNYFRQDIWINIWIQFHFQYIFEGRDDFIHTRHIIVPPQIDCCKLGPPWSIKHVGTSWTLLCKRQLRYLGRNNLEGKYFHISNCILTMKGCADKKLFWDVFLRLTSCVFMKNFRFISPALQVLSKKCQIFDRICEKNIFLPKYLRLYTSQKKELLDLDQNWPKTRHLLFKTWKSSISIDSPIVQWWGKATESMQMTPIIFAKYVEKRHG